MERAVIGRSKGDCLGIDVGTSSVKAARVRTTGRQGVTLLETAIAPLPPGLDREALETETISALKTICDKLPPQGPVQATINDPNLCLAILAMPRMPAGEIKEAVAWEMRNQLSYPVEEAVLDFRVLEAADEQTIPKLHVLVGVLPLETSERWGRIFSKAGIRPRLLTPLPEARQAWLSHVPLGSEEGLVILELGASFAELAIYEKGALKYIRKITFSGSSLTQALTEPLISAEGQIQLNWDDAERVKKTCGIASEPGPVSSSGALTHSQILSLTSSHLEHLSQEISRSLDSYHEEFKDHSVKRLVLFGGTSTLPGLPEFLEEQIGVPVSRGDVSLETQTTENAYLYAGAVAVALASPNSLNLLPPFLSKETRRWIERVSLESLAAAALTTWLVLFLGFRMKIVSYQKRLALGSQELAWLNAKRAELRAQEELATLAQPQELWRDVFKTLSLGTPKSAYLNSFEMTGNGIKIAGILFARGATPELTRFLLALEQGGFRNVRLNALYPVKAAKPTSAFEVVCER